MREKLKALTEQKQAVALYYDGDEAPHVTASGIGPLAKEILSIARENNIPIYENPELVEILSHLDIGDEIPENLYRMVAEIIAFVFYLQGYTLEDIQNRSSKAK